MKGHPGEPVDVHSPADFLKTEVVPAVTDIRAGYRAWVRAYWNGGSCHYAAGIELPVGAGSTDRTALIRYSYHTEPEGFSAPPGRPGTQPGPSLTTTGWAGPQRR